MTFADREQWFVDLPRGSPFVFSQKAILVDANCPIFINGVKAELGAEIKKGDMLIAETAGLKDETFPKFCVKWEI